MTTIAELNAAKEAAIAKMTKTAQGADTTRVVVGLATCGIAAGGNAVKAAFEEAANGLPTVEVVRTGCIGMCQYEPIAEITVPGQEKVTYVNMNAERAREIVQKHLVEGNPIEEYTIGAVTQ